MHRTARSDPTRPLRTALVAVMLTIGLAACGTSPDPGNGDDGGNGGNGGNGGGETDTFGYVVASESTERNGTRLRAQQSVEVSGGAGFVRFDEAVALGEAEDLYADQLDTCEVTSIDVTDDPFQGVPGLDDLSLDFLDAGDPVTIRVQGETDAFLSLDRQSYTFEGATVVGYASETPLSSALPSGTLVADVPGDAFPQVDGAAFPQAEAFTLQTPADPGTSGSVELSTTFTWDAGSGANSFVLLELRFGSLAEPTFVTCVAEDDGSFQLPSDLDGELGAGATGTVERASRTAYAVHAAGDARLMLGVERAETFPLDFGFAR